MNRAVWAGAAGMLLGAALLAYGEDITVTTYYPSPRGVYDELRVNRLVFTDKATNEDYALTMEQGKLLLTNPKDRKSFIIMDISDEKGLR